MSKFITKIFRALKTVVYENFFIILFFVLTTVIISISLSNLFNEYLDNSYQYKTHSVSSYETRYFSETSYEQGTYFAFDDVSIRVLHQGRNLSVNTFMEKPEQKYVNSLLAYDAMNTHIEHPLDENELSVPLHVANRYEINIDDTIQVHSGDDMYVYTVKRFSMALDGFDPDYNRMGNIVLGHQTNLAGDAAYYMIFTEDIGEWFNLIGSPIIRSNVVSELERSNERNIRQILLIGFHMIVFVEVTHLLINNKKALKNEYDNRSNRYSLFLHICYQSFIKYFLPVLIVLSYVYTRNLSIYNRLLITEAFTVMLIFFVIILLLSVSLSYYISYRPKLKNRS